jgi:predicted transcriptional regulator of viral defense system
MSPMDTAKEKAISLIRKQGGIIRTCEAFHQGIHRRTFYGLRDDGALISISRGLYQLAEMDNFPTEIDLVNVAKLTPHGVICLISALSFHGLTTQIPHEIWVAVERKARKPKVTYPPVHAIFFTGPCFEEGIEVHRIMEQEVRIYNAPKTVIDCFRWRDTVGLDVALEAARSYLKRHGASPTKLMEYAKLCKVEKLVTPYLEAMVS